MLHCDAQVRLRLRANKQILNLNVDRFGRGVQPACEIKHRINRFCILALFLFHLSALLYWNFPPSLVTAEPSSQLASFIENQAKSVFTFRRSLRDTTLGSLFRAYIKLFALEQNWWLLSPNPRHESFEFEVSIITSPYSDAKSRETLIMRNLTPIATALEPDADSPCLRRPEFREITALRKLTHSESKNLLIDYARYALRKFAEQQIEVSRKRTLGEGIKSVRVDVLKCDLTKFTTTSSAPPHKRETLYLEILSTGMKQDI